jgi:hypothetical protein
MFDPKNLLDTLIGINNHFGANDDTVFATTVSKRWEHFIDDQCVDEELKDAVVDKRDIHIKINSGNTKSYDRTKDHKSNDEVLRTVENGEPFWIRGEHPDCSDPENAAIDYAFQSPNDGHLIVDH